MHLASGLNGTYLSEVFDAGTTQQWLNISWTAGAYYGGEIGRYVAEDSLITIVTDVVVDVNKVRSSKYKVENGLKDDFGYNDYLAKSPERSSSGLSLSSDLDFSSNLDNSFVFNTSTLSCFLSSFSSDQIGQGN